jgi:hypothetical protein
METGNRWTFDCPNDYETPNDFQAIDLLAGQRGYKNRDIIDISKESMGDQYEANLKMFFHEFVTWAIKNSTPVTEAITAGIYTKTRRSVTSSKVLATLTFAVSLSLCMRVEP